MERLVQPCRLKCFLSTIVWGLVIYCLPESTAAQALHPREGLLPVDRTERERHAQALPSRRIPRGPNDVILSFSPVVKATEPAVVNIFTKRKVRSRSLSPFANDPFFRNFFGDGSFGFFGVPRERIQSTLGSGVLVHPDGFIVTNDHVIRAATEIRIALHNGEEHNAKIVLRDEKTDLAILRLDSPHAQQSIGGLPFLELADSDSLAVGDIVLAIGNPFGVGKTVTSGIVSALARTTLGIADYGFFIQTDAAINPGNSGGALVNLAGQLVGIPTAIFSPNRGANDIGFAVPANMARVVIDSALRGEQRVRRPWFGGETTDLDSVRAAQEGQIGGRGAFVLRVTPGGPADDAGIKAGDVITHIDGRVVENAQAFESILGTLPPGRTVTIAYVRNGLPREEPFVLQLAPESTPRQEVTLRGHHLMSGITVVNLSPATAEEIGVSAERGVAILEIDPGSAANRLGLRPGDIIARINGIALEDTQTLQAVLSTVTGRITLSIIRGNSTLTLSIL